MKPDNISTRLPEQLNRSLTAPKNYAYLVGTHFYLIHLRQKVSHNIFNDPRKYLQEVPSTYLLEQFKEKVKDNETCKSVLNFHKFSYDQGILTKATCSSIVCRFLALAAEDIENFTKTNPELATKHEVNTTKFHLKYLEYIIHRLTYKFYGTPREQSPLFALRNIARNSTKTLHKKVGNLTK
jgi:hypothetical protein